MKIYTKKGDTGKTALMGGEQVDKDALRVEVYGTVDELNAVLGCVLSKIDNKVWVEALHGVQQGLFLLSAELATSSLVEKTDHGLLGDPHTLSLEKQIDEWQSELPDLKKFILPGGSEGAAFLHLARAVCRRAEREAVKLSKQDSLRPEVLRYLNRLSDWFFVLSRLVNHGQGGQEVLWD